MRLQANCNSTHVAVGGGKATKGCNIPASKRLLERRPERPFAISGYSSTPPDANIARNKKSRRGGVSCEQHSGMALDRLSFGLPGRRRREMCVNDQPAAIALLQDETYTGGKVMFCPPARIFEEPSAATQATVPATEMDFQSSTISTLLV